MPLTVPATANWLAPHCVRHEVDIDFCLGGRERIQSDRRLLDEVEFAFGFVRARTALRASG